jgi:hypothetical protein
MSWVWTRRCRSLIAFFAESGIIQTQNAHVRNVTRFIVVRFASIVVPFAIVITRVSVRLYTATGVVFAENLTNRSSHVHARDVYIVTVVMIVIVLKNGRFTQGTGLFSCWLVAGVCCAVNSTTIMWIARARYVSHGMLTAFACRFVQQR